MTTAVLGLASDVTAAAALDRWKQEEAELDVLYYIYVLDKDGVLTGVASMRDLLTAAPQQRLSEIQSSG